MSFIGSSSSSTSSNSTSASATNSTATNSNAAESNANAANSGTGFADLPNFVLRHAISFLDPRDAVNFRLTFKRGPEIADANDVWGEFVTDEAKAALKDRKTTDDKAIPLAERTMTTTTVNDKTVPAVQSWGAYQLAYMSNLSARRLYVGGTEEHAQIAIQLRAHYPANQTPWQVVQYAKLIQLNILRVKDFVDDAGTIQHPLNLNVLTVKVLGRLIDLIQEKKLNRKDLEVLSQSFNILFHTGISFNENYERADKIHLEMIQNYLDLKALEFTAEHIQYFAECSYINDFYKRLQFLVDVLQKKLLTPTQLIELYNQNRQDEHDHFHAMTPTLMKYLEEGLITFDMIKSLGDDIDSFSLFVAVDGNYGNKMRAIYEGLCERVRADGVGSWALFSNGLFKVFAMLFMQTHGNYTATGSYYSAELANPASQSYKLSDAAFWTEIESGELSSDSLFALFAELKAIVTQECSQFSPRLLNNLLFILASQLEAMIKENDSISFKVIRETASTVLKVLLSRQNLIELSKILDMNLFEILEQGEYTEAMLETVNPCNMSPLMHAFMLIHFSLSQKGLKPKAEIQTFVKDLQLLIDFFKNFKKPQKMPAEFDTAEYVEELMGLFMRDLLLGKHRRILSQQLPVLLTVLQNAHDNGILDRFVKAVRAGLPAAAEVSADMWQVDWIVAYLFANHLGALELSDITAFLQNGQGDNFVIYALLDTLTDALDIEGELGALLDGKATKEQWMNMEIDLEALAELELESGSESEGSDESDDVAAPAISGRIRSNNDDDDSNDA